MHPGLAALTIFPKQRLTAEKNPRPISAFRNLSFPYNLLILTQKVHRGFTPRRNPFPLHLLVPPMTLGSSRFSIPFNFSPVIGWDLHLRFNAHKNIRFGFCRKGYICKIFTDLYRAGTVRITMVRGFAGKIATLSGIFTAIFRVFNNLSVIF